MNNKNTFFELNEFINVISSYTQEGVNWILLINRIVSGFSLLGSILCVLIFWFFKEIRNFILELTVWLCISNCLYNITAYFPYDESKDKNKTWCALQAFMIITFQNSCWIWSCIIGYSSFISVIRKNHIEKNRKNYRILFVGLAFIIPIGLGSM
jgi:hypothetical protein